MKLSYKNINPKDGHQSYSIVFEKQNDNNEYHLLIDPGKNANLDKHLTKANQNLLGILITHLHKDHHQDLHRNLRQRPPILLSPTNKKLLEIFLENTSNENSKEKSRILELAQPIDGWHKLMENIEIQPIPAGHTLGATGFIIRFGNNPPKHILVTGDFSLTRSGGYPKFPDLKELPPIDVMFLNTPYNKYRDRLNNSISEIFEKTTNGYKTLVTASNLKRVEYAYLLGNIADKTGINIPINLVGEAAEIYDRLGYDTPNVNPINRFQDPEKIMKRGEVVIAGPSDPTQGSIPSDISFGVSHKLFEAIKDDSNAALIKILDGYRTETDSYDCSVSSYIVSKHPDREFFHELVEYLQPIHTVVQHGNTDEFEGAFDETITWSDNKEEKRTLYNEGDWSIPFWLRNVNPINTMVENYKDRMRVVDRDKKSFDIDRISGDPSEEELIEEGVDFDKLKRTLSGFFEDTQETEENQEQEFVEEKEGIDRDEVVEAVIEAINKSDRLANLEEMVMGEIMEARVIEVEDDRYLLEIDGELDLENGEKIDIQI